MNYSNTGTVEIDVVKEFVDPERVVILNLDEQNEVEATRDITTRFEDADVPLLPPRFLRRIVRAVYQAFPRQNIDKKEKDSSVVKLKLLSKKSSNGLIRWVTDRFRNLTSSPPVEKKKYSSVSNTGRALQLMASSDENEGSTVMDPKMSLQYEKLLDSGDVMCCPRVSNEWELSTRHVTKGSRIRFAGWGFAAVLASLIKFYPFHIQNVKDEDDGEKKIRRPFRTLFDKGAFLTECRHSEKERTILDRVVDTQLFHAFIRDRLQDQLPTPFEKWCTQAHVDKFTAKFVLHSMEKYVWICFKLPRGRRAPCEEDTGDGESFMSFKTKPFSEPIQLSGWRRRYVYITKNSDGVFVLRYHDASKVESIQSSTDWDLASRIRSASHRRDTLHRLLKPATR